MFALSAPIVRAACALPARPTGAGSAGDVAATVAGWGPDGAREARGHLGDAAAKKGEELAAAYNFAADSDHADLGRAYGFAVARLAYAAALPHIGARPSPEGGFVASVGTGDSERTLLGTRSVEALIKQIRSAALASLDTLRAELEASAGVDLSGDAGASPVIPILA